jgi:threonine dehydrogenase-like Zn-dependent dehydrogenase
MKAFVVQEPGRYGIEQRPRPAPGPDQVLVKVGAVGICKSDLEVLDGTRPAPYVRYPVVLGHEWAGTVETVGAAVREVTVGDRVAVEGHNFCRTCVYCRRGETNLCEHYNEFGFTLPGGYSEYVAVRADLVHPVGSSLTLEEAALCEPASCAGYGVMRSRVRPGDTVVIIGPGTIGLLAAAWFRLYHPQYLILIGRRAHDELLLKNLGATRIIDLQREDAREVVRALTGGRGADVVFEAAGHPDALALAFELVRRGGVVVLEGIVGGHHRLSFDPDLFCLKDLRVEGVFAYTSAVFTTTITLISRGVLQVASLINRVLPLEAYEEAFRLLRDRVQLSGKVLLRP